MATTAALTDGSTAGTPRTAQKTRHQQRGNSTIVIPELWKRLVWAEKRAEPGVHRYHWWPALAFQNAMELFSFLKRRDGNVRELQELNDAKHRLGLAMLTGPDSSYVLYLGRPITDFGPIEDGTYHDFVRNMPDILMSMSLQPNAFDNDRRLYLDWHLALDEAYEIFSHSGLSRA